MGHREFKAEIQAAVLEAYKHAAKSSIGREIPAGGLGDKLPKTDAFRFGKLDERETQASFVVKFMESWDAREGNIKKRIASELGKGSDKIDDAFSGIRVTVEQQVAAALKEWGRDFNPGRLGHFGRKVATAAYQKLKEYK